MPISEPATPAPAPPAGRPAVLSINGPTASGKSSLAIEVVDALAVRGIGAEIVNADSMLVYRGMDIGTAKPSRAELARARHHLVDILDVTQTATVADFQTRARAAIADCRARGVVPIVVGGSALYQRAILDEFDFPGTDPAVRARWEAELERHGPEALHAELAERDPAAAAQMLPGNGRRIVRALEIHELTGVVRPSLPEWTYAIDGVRAFGLELDRAVMDQRIADRVDAMWDAGLVDEVRGLLTAGLREGVTASKALGYRQVIDLLDGVLTDEQAREQTINRTRRFARKQLGWFRRDHRIAWLQAGDPTAASTIADAAVPGVTTG